MMQRVCEVELQRRADNAGTIFLVGANFLGKAEEPCHYVYWAIFVYFVF